MTYVGKTASLNSEKEKEREIENQEGNGLV
jgi:hypothetical protein